MTRASNPPRSSTDSGAAIGREQMSGGTLGSRSSSPAEPSPLHFWAKTPTTRRTPTSPTIRAEAFAAQDGQSFAGCSQQGADAGGQLTGRPCFVGVDPHVHPPAKDSPQAGETRRVVLPLDSDLELIAGEAVRTHERRDAGRDTDTGLPSGCARDDHVSR